MDTFSCPVLEHCLERFPDANAATLIRTGLAHAADIDALLPLYDQLIPALEAAMWESGLDPARVADLQALFAEMEGHIAAVGEDSRHRIVVVVPVADRPRHLRTCLQSLAGAAQAFHTAAGRLAVVIADDSRDAGNIAANRAIAAEIGQRGIETIYFGLEAQVAEIKELGAAEQRALQNIIGTFAPAAFWHKGASITRNITYLMLNRMARRDDRQLFLFVDSDQEFHTNTDPGREVYTTNYYYHIDRIFRQSGVEVLTGKVVGDPPVSPAVMAGTLLEDVLALLAEISALGPDAGCTFHQGSLNAGSAAYHDMAKLFGFAQQGGAHRYRCTLPGQHDHAACLSGFARRLSRFFDGEHPTRITPYRHVDVQASLMPARTVYTGNYVLSPAALRYFIPFAGLQLRMAGPVLGRLIQAGSGAAFVSANLPLLHRRTEEVQGVSEFRPGVDRSMPLVDLSGEFERQFFGDVMLFTVIELVAQGYPEVTPGYAEIREQLLATEMEIRAQYAEVQRLVRERLDDLDALLSDPGRWWQHLARYAETRSLFEQFAVSLRANFDDGARAWQLIDDTGHREVRHAAMAAALAAYREDRESWDRVLRA
jgi:hypothetical protein